jgi:hypothetical protein
LSDTLVGLNFLSKDEESTSASKKVASLTLDSTVEVENKIAIIDCEQLILALEAEKSNLQFQHKVLPEYTHIHTHTHTYICIWANQ